MTLAADISHIWFKIDGAQASANLLADLLEVTVDHTLHLPSMFTIRVHAHDMTWLEDATLREGKKIDIYIGEKPAVKVLSGLIASLEPDLNVAAPALVVRGYALSHRLYRGRHRRSFLQVTDSDLVKKLAGEAGLTPGQIDSTSVVHEYVFQNNQSNAEFLSERAQRIGYELWVEDDKLNFRKPSPNGAPTKLAWGEELTGFRTRLSTAEQVNEVEVRGWNPKDKRTVTGRATRGQGQPDIGAGTPGADVAKRAWGEAKIAVVDQFVRSDQEADTLAQATLDELASAFVEAEGECIAMPNLAPGGQVKIEGVGQRFSGTYYLTQVTHVWTRAEGTVTHFTVSGRRDRGLWSLLDAAATPRKEMTMLIGVVTNNKDPEELGRVKVKFPTLSDKDESAWARVVSPMAGAGRGFFYLPEVDDEVVVDFEDGDIHRPYVLGVLWNGKDKTPIQASEAVGGDGKVNKRVLKSRSGHTITLNDTAGGEQITIIDKTGDNKIVFNSPTNEMQIKVKGNLTIEADGKITLKGTQGVDMSTDAAFTIKGQTGVDVSSQAQLKLAGQAGAEMSSNAQTAVKGMTTSVEGQTATEVKGLAVNVNGSAAVNVQGGIIKLN